MNPYLWVFIVLLALDAIRENAGLSSLSALINLLLSGISHWIN
ncbi:KPN_01571 family protein [Enterobacter ludwigii]|jgi:hypothetical protein|uniref:Uncharacterized protein n=1 Tax=Enterobacter ludwigii TaxID=299767 RepID=G8LEF4_9ENTR|nr:hypothetical protein EcWSU1_02578 [Enterobacter ludwigii]MBQ0224736.1 KPN_01571 family protein [Enterobacter ludwigii]MBQ0309242.1 KPN_01571 family protein [Enterobacter ludwigii]MBT1847230.1 KPN_01571 family protein [Enterobacter ludwigii]QWZ67301.1 KPN_01571 family protein [Enterobacter ludwigii]